MGEKKTNAVNRLSSFVDSPFTWGGLSMLATAFLSPPYFRYAFIAAGIAIAIGALRASFGEGGSLLSRVAGVLFCAGLAVSWVALWRIVPKPAEPLSKEELRQVVRDELTSVSGPGSAPRSASITTTGKNTILRTRDEISDALRQVLMEFMGRKLHQASLLTVEVPPSSLPPPAPAASPVISSVPSIFHDGQITGKNFGGQPGRVYLHVRVKPAAQRGVYSNDTWEGPGPENLLGNLIDTNYPLLMSDIPQQWREDGIQLKFPSRFWNDLTEMMFRMAESRRIAAPEPLDLEVGYLVETTDGMKSGWFYSP